MKQFVRDLHGRDVMIDALHAEALAEYGQRDQRKQVRERELESIAELVQYGISTGDAERIVAVAGQQAEYASAYANYAAKRIGAEAARALFAGIQAEPDLGDFRVRQALRQAKLMPPPTSDNGPALRRILAGGLTVLGLDPESRGEVFSCIPTVQPSENPGASYLQ